MAFARASAALAAPAHGATAAATGENTPLDLGSAGSNAHAAGGGSIVRTIVGLFIVIAVIYGVSWILRQLKGSRDTRSSGSGLASVATLPLGTGRSLHLIRAGQELLLVGVAEHGVTPIRRYDDEEARAAGFVIPDDDAGGAAGPGGPMGTAGTGLGEGETTPRRLLGVLRRMTVRS